MARIETYNFDTAVSVNDFVIGTDGDDQNATKNFRVLTFLDYLGTQYNLNSTDLLFDYNAVTAVSVGEGEVSTNNFADGTILMSGVTNIYVSKISAFGQLIDDIIDHTGTNNLSIMFTDMGNRNNTAIFTVDSTVDVNANVIDMAVTLSSSVGTITSGRVMGIRIGVGGGGGASSWLTLTDTPSSYAGEAAKIPVVNVGETALELTDDYVTQTTQQLDISGFKSFTSGGANPLQMSANIAYGLSVGYSSASTNGYIQFLTQQAGNFDTSWNPSSFQGTEHQYRIGINQGDWILQGGGTGVATVIPYTRLDQSNYTANRTQTWQNKDGTIAHLADIPTVDDTAYDATSWDANTDAPTKNAVRDAIEGLAIPTASTIVTEVADTGHAANTVAEVLTLTIAANSMADGDLIEFQARFTIDSGESGDQIGIIIDGGSIQGVTNVGGGVSHAYMTGHAIRNGSGIRFSFNLDVSGTGTSATYDKAGLTFTSDIDFSIACGGTVAPLDTVVLNSGFIKQL